MEAEIYCSTPLFTGGCRSGGSQPVRVCMSCVSCTSWTMGDHELCEMMTLKSGG